MSGVTFAVLVGRDAVLRALFMNAFSSYLCSARMDIVHWCMYETQFHVMDSSVCAQCGIDYWAVTHAEHRRIGISSMCGFRRTEYAWSEFPRTFAFEDNHPLLGFEALSIPVSFVQRQRHCFHIATRTSGSQICHCVWLPLLVCRAVRHILCTLCVLAPTIRLLTSSGCHCHVFCGFCHGRVVGRAPSRVVGECIFLGALYLSMWTWVALVYRPDTVAYVFLVLAHKAELAP